MNRIAFQNRLKTYGLFLSATQGQLDGCFAIIDEWEKQGFTDARQLSYVLATVYHETGKKMQPVEEIGKGKSHPYGSKMKYGGGPGLRVAYTTPDKIYYGRGLVQITWYEMYQKFGKLLSIDLLNKPELALRMDISVQILIQGMDKGLFTGKRLSDYFGAKEDRINARRIINSLDCATMIAGYSNNFYKCLI